MVTRDDRGLVGGEVGKWDQIYDNGRKLDFGWGACNRIRRFK